MPRLSIDPPSSKPLQLRPRPVGRTAHQPPRLRDWAGLTDADVTGTLTDGKPVPAEIRVSGGGGKAAPATLLWALDETSTGMGARLLRSWILRPQIERGEIEARLDAVGDLREQTLARDEIRKELRGVLDLERLTTATLERGTPPALNQPTPWFVLIGGGFALDRVLTQAVTE